VVEGQVKFTRLKFFVPVPQMRDLAELNTQLNQRCVADRERRLPVNPFEACRKFSTTASSLSLLRFDWNDYSVPVRWGSWCLQGFSQG